MRPKAARLAFVVVVFVGLFVRFALFVFCGFAPDRKKITVQQGSPGVSEAILAGTESPTANPWHCTSKACPRIQGFGYLRRVRRIGALFGFCLSGFWVGFVGSGFWVGFVVVVLRRCSAGFWVIQSGSYG